MFSVAAGPCSCGVWGADKYGYPDPQDYDAHTVTAPVWEMPGSTGGGVVQGTNLQLVAGLQSHYFLYWFK